MVIYDKHITAGQGLKKRARQQFYTAVIEYISYGRAPRGITEPEAQALFDMAMNDGLENVRAQQIARQERFASSYARR